MLFWIKVFLDLVSILGFVEWGEIGSAFTLTYIYFCIIDQHFFFFEIKFLYYWIYFSIFYFFSESKVRGSKYRKPKNPNRFWICDLKVCICDLMNLFVFLNHYVFLMLLWFMNMLKTLSIFLVHCSKSRCCISCSVSI